MDVFEDDRKEEEESEQKKDGYEKKGIKVTTEMWKGMSIESQVSPENLHVSGGPQMTRSEVNPQRERETGG